MREIKFRAWLKEQKEMVVVDELCLGDKSVYYYRFDDLVGDFKNFKYIELMQYTGIKDRNEKEIYEGDILSDNNRDELYRIVFENGSYRAEFEEYSLDLIDVAHFCEIVGNIYENQELLGENEDVEV